MIFACRDHRIGPRRRSRRAISNSTGNPRPPATIATITGGKFFRAGDTQELEDSFEAVRETLDKTRRKVVERKPVRALGIDQGIETKIDH